MLTFYCNLSYVTTLYDMYKYSSVLNIFHKLLITDTKLFMVVFISTVHTHVLSGQLLLL